MIIALAALATADPSPVFSTEISLGNLLQLLAFLVGGLVFVYTMRSNIDVIGKTTDLRFTQISADIDDFKRDIQKLNQAIMQIAEQNLRITMIDERYSQRLSAFEERFLSSTKRLDQTLADTGHRVDDVSSRLNQFVDMRALRKE
jgi:regulator of replication initiation timing